RGAVYLVQVEAVAEQAAGLFELLREARMRELLRLVHGRVHPPASRVAVAPLAPDRERLARHASLGEPAGEELLGPPVAPRDVDVADAGGTRGVEEVGRACVQRVRRALSREDPCAAARDVSGTPDRGEAQPEPGHCD